MAGPHAAFDPRSLSDEALAALRKLALSRIQDTSSAFAGWLHSWIDTEQFWRSKSATHRPARHILALPPVAEWSNSELGGALRAVTHVGFLPMPESVGEFIDRISLGLVEIAAERLAETPQRPIADKG